jgi:hypothetical protein
MGLVLFKYRKGGHCGIVPVAKKNGHFVLLRWHTGKTGSQLKNVSAKK